MIKIDDQAILAEDASARMVETNTRHKTDALLRGLLYGTNDEKYRITYSTKKSGKRYRYYIPASDQRYGAGTSATGMLPADQIEEVVVNLLCGALQSPEAVQGVWHEVRRHYPHIDEPTVVLAMRRLGEVWPQVFPAEQVRLVNLLIERVQLLADGIDQQPTMSRGRWIPSHAPHSSEHLASAGFDPGQIIETAP